MVIQDIRMGHSDSGWHIIDALRREPTTQHIPVLIVSHEPDVQQKATQMQLENCDMLPTPFDPHELVQKVEALAHH